MELATGAPARHDMTTMSTRGRCSVLTQPACEQMLQHHTAAIKVDPADATPWRLRAVSVAVMSPAVLPRRPKRQAARPARYQDGAPSSSDEAEARKQPRSCAPEGAKRLKLPSPAAIVSTVQDIAHTDDAESCGGTADEPQLRRSTRERRPSTRAVAASAPAGAGNRGEVPLKKRCAPSQLSLQRGRRPQRQRLETSMDQRQTPQEIVSQHACIATSLDAHADDEHGVGRRPKRARKPPARFDELTFAPASEAQDTATRRTPSARVGRGSRRSQPRCRCPASVRASPGRRTAPTQAKNRRAKTNCLPSLHSQSAEQHVTSCMGTPVSPAQGNGLPFDRGKEWPRFAKRKRNAPH